MTKHYDAVIIGAGHNGLVCAFYLARAGLKVRLVERRAVVGGAAVTEEFHPGFRNSVASYTVSLLQPQVIRDMKLEDEGYRVIERPISNFLPQEDGGYLKLGGGLERTQAEFERFSPKDAAVLPAYYDMLDAVADGSEVQLDGRSIADWERYRDDCLMAVQAAVKATKLKHGIAPDA
jgi:phytoene dehydrogenase-like protein